jgi:uncharacterized protein
VSLIGLLGFGTVVLLAMLLLHGYLWFRLVRSTTRPGALRRRLTLLTLVLAILPALAVTLRRTLPLDVAAPLDWVAYSWLGIAFYTFLALLVLEPVRLVGSLIIRRKDRQVVPSGARRAPRARRAAASRRPGRHLAVRMWASPAPVGLTQHLADFGSSRGSVGRSVRGSLCTRRTCVVTS